MSYHYDRLEVFGEVEPPATGYANAYRRRREETVRAIQKHVPAGGTVLDVASAQGNFALTLAELGYRVTWNDLRAELADYVRLKLEYGEVDFRPGNAFELEFPEPFDAVLITEVIEHVAHPDDFLRMCARLVKPTGAIVMTTPNGAFFRNTLPKFSECDDPSVFESVQFGPNSADHIFLLHAHEVHTLAERAGLRVVDLGTYSNFLTAGKAGTGRLLPLLPKRAVDAIERVTSWRGGNLASRLNTNMAAVLVPA